MQTSIKSIFIILFLSPFHGLPHTLGFDLFSVRKTNANKTKNKKAHITKYWKMKETDCLHRLDRASRRKHQAVWVRGVGGIYWGKIAGFALQFTAVDSLGVHVLLLTVWLPAAQFGCPCAAFDRLVACSTVWVSMCCFWPSGCLQHSLGVHVLVLTVWLPAAQFGCPCAGFDRLVACSTVWVYMCCFWPSGCLQSSFGGQTRACSKSNASTAKTHGFCTSSHFGPHLWNNLPQDIRQALCYSLFLQKSAQDISLLRIFQLNHIVLHSHQSVQCVCVCVCIFCIIMLEHLSMNTSSFFW